MKLVWLLKLNVTIGHLFALTGIESSGSGSLLSRRFAKGHGELPNTKGDNMKSRKMKQCIAGFEAVHKRGDLEPEQEQAIQFVILRLKQLSRLKKASNQETYDCVADISEKLVKAFCKLNIKL